MACLPEVMRDLHTQPDVRSGTRQPLLQAKSQTWGNRRMAMQNARELYAGNAQLPSGLSNCQAQCR
jgi:hypothetical protein